MYFLFFLLLDNGVEDDDDDEFGEFGGFLEVSFFGVGFVDFDIVDYICFKEEFVFLNYFMLIYEFLENVDSFISFKFIKNGNDKDIIVEFFVFVKGQFDVLFFIISREIILFKILDIFIDGMESLGNLNKVVEQRQNVGIFESFFLGDFRINMNVVY